MKQKFEIHNRHSVECNLNIQKLTYVHNENELTHKMDKNVLDYIAVYIRIYFNVLTASYNLCAYENYRAISIRMHIATTVFVKITTREHNKLIKKTQKFIHYLAD